MPGNEPTDSPGVQQLLDSFPFYVMLLDADHRILMANEAVQKDLHLSAEGALGQYCPRVVHGLDGPFPGCPLEDAVRTGAAVDKTLFDAATNAWMRYMVYPLPGLSGKPLYMHFAQDVTRQKQTEDLLREREEELQRTRRLEALGRMARGVVHDFGNMLTLVRGHCEMVMRSVDKDTVSFQHLTVIQEVSKQATAMTRQLLSFARSQEIQTIRLELNQLISDMRKMLDYMCPSGVNLRFDLSQERMHIEADSGQLEQVLVNLVVNAAEAMPGGGGTITIKTELATVGEDYCTRKPEARPGSFACLSVTDTGSGMGADVLRQLFAPYFTTKGDKGTGLGLSTVYGIVKQHNGWLDVSSQPDRGSSFSIFLELAPSPQGVRLVG